MASKSKATPKKRQMVSKDLHEFLKEEVKFPVSRVKVIMKSAPNVDYIAQDAAVVMAKLTQMFITHLATEANKFRIAQMKVNKKSPKNKQVFNYSDLSDYIHSTERLNFLRELAAPMITFGEVKEILRKKKLLEKQKRRESRLQDGIDYESSDEETESDSDDEIAENRPS